MGAAEYFHKVKNLIDILATIGKPLSDDEIVTYVLDGLDKEYDRLVTSLTTCVEQVTLSDL